VVAVVAPEQAPAALAAWRALPLGRDAALIGKLYKSKRFVVMQTALGGERMLDELEDDPLPRIC
jgi:hydrogenase expression/formation protein HypE